MGPRDIYKYCKTEMWSGRTIRSIKKEAASLYGAEGKYNYRSEEFGHISKKLNAIKSASADTSGNPFKFRWHCFYKQQNI